MDLTKYTRIIYQPGKVARIILNRPRYRNALSHPLFREMEQAFDEAERDPQCHVIVLSGAGPCFCAGDDAMGLSPESAPMMADERTPAELMQHWGSERELWRRYWTEHDYYVNDQWVNKIRRMAKPTIAMVHGYAIFMGFNLARAMDLVFASDEALFLPAGTTAMWDVGHRKMMEVMLEHRFMTARECLESQLVSRIYPNPEVLETETLAFANRVAENPTSSNRRVKERINRTLDLQGFTGSYFDRLPYDVSFQQRNVPREERHRERYEGRGMARTPRAYANLKAKLESEGADVPSYVSEALARAAARDDRAAWERALHQDWREQYRIQRAEADAKVFEEAKDKD